MFKRVKDDFWLLKRSGKHILIFELTYKLAATAVIYPLVVWLARLIMKTAGVKYLTNEYILRIFKNPLVWIVLLAAVILFVLYCTYEM